MMEHSDILLIALPFLLFGLVSRRLDRSPISAPMIFTGIGLLAAPEFFAILHFEIGPDILFGIAEITLILVLFADAARIELSQLRRIYSLPLRLLLIGLPLVIAFGTLAAWGLYDNISLFTALLIAAILAPTDAALGLAVVEDRRVPQRIRETLSVESGLNDGLALPAILILISLAGAMGGMSGMVESPAYWITFAVEAGSAWPSGRDCRRSGRRSADPPRRERRMDAQALLPDFDPHSCPHRLCAGQPDWRQRLSGGLLRRTCLRACRQGHARTHL